MIIVILMIIKIIIIIVIIIIVAIIMIIITINIFIIIIMMMIIIMIIFINIIITLITIKICKKKNRSSNSSNISALYIIATYNINIFFKTYVVATVAVISTSVIYWNSLQISCQVNNTNCSFPDKLCTCINHSANLLWIFRKLVSTLISCNNHVIMMGMFTWSYLNGT